MWHSTSSSNHRPERPCDDLSRRGEKRTFLRACLIVSAALLILGCSGRESAVSGADKIPGYDVYVNQQIGISLSKPKDWNVFVLKGAVLVKPLPDSSTGVFLLPILRAHPKMEAVSFIRVMADQARIDHPDLMLEEKRTNRDNTVAEVTARYTENKTRETIKGFYLVSIKDGRGVFCGYEAPVGAFDNNHTVLRNVLKGLTITPAAFVAAADSGQLQASARTPSPQTVTPTIDIRSLTVKLSEDRTMYLAVPPDWKVGGGNYSLIATPPGEKMGITATNDGQPKTRDPYTYLMNALMPFYRCTATTLHKREANQDLMNFSRSQGYTSKAENFVGETTQGSGRRVIFWIMVNAATLPHGMGFVSTIGFFAVPELFERNSGVLYAMTMSMGPNQQEIMGRLRENLDRLGQASRTMSATGDVVIQALRSHTATWDRAMDKYNYYLSGEEARYSPLEKRIYVVDSNLESYAGNPRYPQEILSNVPDNLWNKLPHERR